jgi:phage FluMu gp28-like protein
MPAILPNLSLDKPSVLTRYFTEPQLLWIGAEDFLHAQNQQAYALAEKSVRIGWTYADAFKNVRKRLRFPGRDYLFATKDWPSALEYMRLVYRLTELFSYTRTIVSHGEDWIRVKPVSGNRRSRTSRAEVKIGYVKFDNGSRIIAFSANPYAMAVYGGDVGLDEFAKHPNASLLWQTAQGRVTWGYDLAIWSSHDGEDTLFHKFAQEARAGKGPWNLYFRVTMPDALDAGLLDVINNVQRTQFSREQFLKNCRARSGSEEIYQQSYLCNPAGSTTAAIVEWSAIERCRSDYHIERVHLEADDIRTRFGNFEPGQEAERLSLIRAFLKEEFKKFRNLKSTTDGWLPRLCLGFDVAASGKGDLAVIYIDELDGGAQYLRALFTCRTEDWHFLKTALFFFLEEQPEMHGAGDETGLGRQICWEAAAQFPNTFSKINFASKKSELGFALMNQLSVAEKRFPRSDQDIAADFFALRKVFASTRWIFTESPNTFNTASHCDIAWAAAISSSVRATVPTWPAAMVG